MSTSRTYLLLLALLLSLDAAAQPITVSARTDRSSAGVGDRVIYQLHIEGFRSFAEVITPEPPTGLTMRLESSAPYVERKTIAVNGRLQQALTFSWHFRATRSGTARIASEGVTVRSQRIQVPVVTVQVADAPIATRSSLLPSETRQGTTIRPGDLSIRAVPATRQAYQNEQVLVSYWLYYREGIDLRGSTRLSGSWDAEGFWREELDIDQRPVPESVIENGVRYNRFLLKSVAVFPTRTGALRIDPLRISTEASVVVRSEDPMDRLFDLPGEFHPVEVVSPAVQLVVKPLPAGAPAGFTGAVGQYRLEVDVEDEGTSVAVVATVRGEGNIAMLAPPPFVAPDGFDLHAPQVTSEIKRAGQVYGSRTFRYVLVPRRNGRFRLPGVAFTYFDPRQGRYLTLRSEPVEVEERDVVASEGAISTARGMPTNDVTDIVNSPGSWRRSGAGPLVTRSYFWAVLLLLAAAIIGSDLFFRRRKAGRRSRPEPADAVARRHLARAESLLRKGEIDRFYDEVDLALRSHLSARIGPVSPGVSRREVERRMIDAEIDVDERMRILSLLEESDQTRFSPVRPSGEQMQRALHTIRALLQRSRVPEEAA